MIIDMTLLEKNKQTAVLVGNTSWSLVNFRKGLLEALKARGYHTITCAPHDHATARLIKVSDEHISFSLSQRGLNPLKDLAYFFRLLLLLRRVKPTFVVLYTIKPVIYGAVASRLCGIPVISVITGLGRGFSGSLLLRKFLILLYRVSQRRVSRVFVLNEDDKKFVNETRLINPQRLEVLPSEGVDINYFWDGCKAPCDSLDCGIGSAKFLFIGRILWEKGLKVLIDSARKVKMSFPEAQFLVLGFVEETDGPSSQQISLWEAEGLIKYVGSLDDVRPMIADSDCILLPSLHREGIPRALLEGAAMGKPLIASRIPGCKEVIEDSVNGFLFESGSVQELTDALFQFLELPAQKRVEMGVRGRAKVQREFSEHLAIQKYFSVLESISDDI